MRAAIFEGRERIVLGERPIPQCGPNDAIVKTTLTTICGTDVHIWREEYPVERGRIVGHEPVGVIHELGEAVSGYEIGDRVLVGAITPCGTCFYCQSHSESQCSGYEDEWQMIGGWRLGNSIDGVQADFVRIPYAQANLAKIPDDLSDEQCVMLADIASTGMSAAERADVRIGETVAVFAQGPIGLCATAGARLMGAALIIAVDSIEGRLELSRRMGADEVIDHTEEDPVAAIKRLTGGRGLTSRSRPSASRAPSSRVSTPPAPAGGSPASASTGASSSCPSRRTCTGSGISRFSPRCVRAARSGCAS